MTLKYSLREHTYCSDQKVCAMFLPKVASGREAPGERGPAFVCLHGKKTELFLTGASGTSLRKNRRQGGLLGTTNTWLWPMNHSRVGHQSQNHAGSIATQSLASKDFNWKTPGLPNSRKKKSFQLHKWLLRVLALEPKIPPLTRKKTVPERTFWIM